MAHHLYHKTPGILTREVILSRERQPRHKPADIYFHPRQVQVIVTHLEAHIAQETEKGELRRYQLAMSHARCREGGCQQPLGGQIVSVLARTIPKATMTSVSASGLAHWQRNVVIPAIGVMDGPLPTSHVSSSI